MAIDPEDVDSSTDNEQIDSGVSVSYPNAPHSDEWSDELREQVEDAKYMGWEIDKDFGNRVIMVKRSVGGVGAHAFILIFTFWSMGLVNAVYAIYHYFGKAEQKVLRDSDNQ